tara:strand:+ start:1681 stop:2574 length:894 start_codon:yes stop_codon:yes gene_type:complete
MKNIIFFGYGSEYLLGPIASGIKTHNIIQIDNYKFKYNIDDLKKDVYETIIFSCHLNLDKFLYNYHYKNIDNFISPNEILEQLKINKKYYLIHDLSEFYLNDEINYLQKIDKILSPIQYNDPLFKNKILDIGWIKNCEVHDEKNIKNKNILFLSDVGYYEKNFQFFVKDFEEKLKSIELYKLPVMSEKPEKIINFLRGKNINEINETENSYKFLSKNNIYTNGFSSIIFETLTQNNTVHVIKSRTNELLDWSKILMNPFKDVNFTTTVKEDQDYIIISPLTNNLNLEFNYDKFIKIL